MAYIDGLLVPVPHDAKEAYLRKAREMWPLLKKHGALRTMETWGDDVPHGQVTDFYKAVQAKDGENVVFTWIVWPSKAARDDGWRKLMADMEGQAAPEMPFDGKRMFWGGFAPLFDSDNEGES
jgi:uncharacterized protein YbaA (DUF1428 family)